MTCMIVVNESNQFRETIEHVDTHLEFQAGLESSFRPDPSKPISVNIAADFNRSKKRSKTIKGTTVLTRTVAFRVKPPTSKSEHKEEFEVNLHSWLAGLRDPVCVKCPSCKDANAAGEQHQCSQSTCVYDRTTNHHCIDYLRQLGGVTHYISSVTLGGQRYQVSQNTITTTSLSTSSGMAVESCVSAATKSRATKKLFQSSSERQQIGQIPNRDVTNNEVGLLQFGTKGEAVVRCSYNSLANLISHPELRRQLDLGIQEYIDLQKNGTRGPYHIASAEMRLVHDGKSNEKERQRLYWTVRQIEKETTVNYKIECTFIQKEASNFYLKPFCGRSGEEEYFYIVTDPEENQGQLEYTTHLGRRARTTLKLQEEHFFDAVDTFSAATGDQHQQSEEKLDQEKETKQVKTKREPPRFIQVHDQELQAGLIVNKHKGHSVFKLKNPQNGKTCSLSRSQWLPEASLGSQPYVICLEGLCYQQAFRHDSLN